MKFLPDTANTEEIRDDAEYGLIDGPVGAEVLAISGRTP